MSKKNTIRIDSFINQDLSLLVPRLPKINYQSTWNSWLKKLKLILKEQLFNYFHIKVLKFYKMKYLMN